MIFDCDGVLVDSEPISNAVLARMLTEQGLPTTTAESRREYQGMLLGDIRADASRRLGRELPQQWVELYERERDREFAVGLRAIAGAQQLVERCLAAGFAVCVASQGSLAKTSRSLSLTGLDSLFAAHARFSAYQVPRGKPHPDLFLHAARTIGVPPRECTVIEDTPSGVSAGVRAGMRVLGYAGDADAAALEAAGAEVTIDSLIQAWPLLAPVEG
ncbi:MAG TPA: HAD family phosphatase [Solirubrobacteraceae bacterium]